MASGKLSPRQKMIGMMYLVLTAILALNVSKDILDAFVTVNSGLENTGRSFDKDINTLYAKFDEKKSIDPLRVVNNWKKAQEARKLSKEMNAYLDALKKRLIRESEGFENKEEDTLRLEFLEGKEEYNKPTYILCGDAEDGSNGVAHELRGKLNAYHGAMMALLSPEAQKQIHLNIETPDPGTGEFRTWEMKTFYHTPLAADITILSKIEDDVKGAESDIVDALLRETDSDIIPFDTVAARVIAQTNYVMQGEQYQADIFLAAFNKTLSPQIYIGKYDSASGKMIGAFDSVNVQNGMGRYFVNTSQEGIMSYEGVINMKTPKGTMMHFPFRQEYIVARPALTVSADKMNVMYAGLENPISISVPGVPNEKVHPVCDNGQLVSLGNGKYKVINPRPGPSHITVTADMANGEKRNMGSMEFRVKPLPSPITVMSGISGSRATKAQASASPGLIPSYGPDFVFQAQPRIISYRIAIYKGGIFVCDDPVSGNVFPKKYKDIFALLKKGDKILISEVKAMGPDNNPVSSNDITVTIQ